MEKWNLAAGKPHENNKLETRALEFNPTPVCLQLLRCKWCTETWIDNQPLSCWIHFRVTKRYNIGQPFISTLASTWKAYLLQKDGQPPFRPVWSGGLDHNGKREDTERKIKMGQGCLSLHNVTRMWRMIWVQSCISGNQNVWLYTHACKHPVYFSILWNYCNLWTFTTQKLLSGCINVVCLQYWLQNAMYGITLYLVCNNKPTLGKTRTTRMPAFWDTFHSAMITHTNDSHQIPSKKKDKVKVTNFKKLPKIFFF